MTEVRGNKGHKGIVFGGLQRKGSWPQDARGEGGGFRWGEWNGAQNKEECCGPNSQLKDGG